MRELFGMGTPHGLVGYADLALASYLAIVALLRPLVGTWRGANREVTAVALTPAAA